MDGSGRILVFGASTRAAAFSAVRAGLQPWCVDLFADRDLQARCPVLPACGKYPETFLDAIKDAPPGPWMYAGGLENHPRLVGQMSRGRELWGNGPTALAWARNPMFVADTVHAAGLAVPVVCAPALGFGGMPTADRRWLIKPIKSVGGRDIHLWSGGEADRPGRGSYLQEFIAGEPAAAIFVGDGQTARLLGVTCQLVGESFCHAKAFQYCGSIGPLIIAERLRADVSRLGDVLTRACHLRGLFGVDGVLRDGVFWPVEVNPRYTASVEVLEYTTGLRALAWHAAAFDPGVVQSAIPARADSVVGKAILFAKRDSAFPASGPWDAALQGLQSLESLPAFADIPAAGDPIMAGRPILTLFARGTTLATCRQELRRIAVDLDHWLFG